jgi:hypothetical protein
MNEMLRVNMRENLQIVVQIATKYSDILGPVRLIEMFESFKSFEGSWFCDSGLYINLIFCDRPVLLSRFRCEPQHRS